MYVPGTCVVYVPGTCVVFVCVGSCGVYVCVMRPVCCSVQVRDHNKFVFDLINEEENNVNNYIYLTRVYIIEKNTDCA